MDLCCFGNRIRKTRMNCGITQEKLAEMVDIMPLFILGLNYSYSDNAVNC